MILDPNRGHLRKRRRSDPTADQAALTARLDMTAGPARTVVRKDVALRRHPHALRPSACATRDSPLVSDARHVIAYS